jgi:hypothetical protein
MTGFSPRAGGSARQGLIFALGAFVLAFAALSPRAAMAQNSEYQRSYIDPFPRGDRYRVVVLGDTLADGLWSGLYRGFQEDPNFEIVNKSKPGSGFTRANYDWNTAIDDILKDETYQIAVVMFGASENQPIKTGGEVLKPGTDEWDEAYGKKVEAFIKKLRAKNIAVYWVGLPIMRGPDEAEDAEILNEIFREKAFINGAKFIDTWSGFADESGRFSPYGPDMQGQVRRLRADDGVNFTPRGNLKLAHFPEKDIRRDLSLAKLERNIPLAGSEDEQAKVMGRAVVSPNVPGAAPTPEQTPEDSAVPATSPKTEDTAAAPSEEGEPPAPQVEQSKVGEVDVVRPVISATTLEAAQSLTPQGAAASLPDSENIMGDLPGGLTALASISSVNDPTVASSKPRLPLTQRPYYRVLIKGEQLKPKPGRADDFTWPHS